MDTGLEIAGIAIEAAFLLLLMRKHAYRLLPIFCAYIGWGLVSDAVMLFLRYRFPAHYFQSYVVELSLDSVLQYLVLVELTWSVLRPFRNLLPRGTIVGISLLVVAVGAVAWPFSSVQGMLGFPPQWHFLARLQQTIAILRILIFLALAAGSHVLAIGWRDRELQVATGLGLFSLASLSGSVLHIHQALGPRYHVVDELVAASYLCSLLYWVFSFVHAEAPRREFTPQMNGLLLALATAAGAQRSQVARLTSIDAEKHGLP